LSPRAVSISTGTSADAAQRLHARQARHHHVQHHDGVAAGGGLAHRRLAVMHAGHAEALAQQVLLQQAGQFEVVIDEENGVHGARVSGCGA
jgi:hypothetical protein